MSAAAERRVGDRIALNRRVRSVRGGSGGGGGDSSRCVILRRGQSVNVNYWVT